MRWLKLVAISAMVFVGAILATAAGVVVGGEVGSLMDGDLGEEMSGVLAGYVVLFLYVLVVVVVAARSRRKALQREMEDRLALVSAADAVASHAVRNAELINQQYALFRTQSSYSFVVTVTAALAGAVVLIVAVMADDVEVTKLTGFGAVFSEVLAGGLLLLHRRADRHVTRFADHLRRSDARLLAAQLIAEMPDSDAKQSARTRLITALIVDGEIEPSESPEHIDANAAAASAATP